MSKWDPVANQVQFNLDIAAEELTNLVPNEAKILDFGCGYGRITQQLQNLGYKNVIGIDNSEEMINRGLKYNPNLDLRHLATHKLPFADGAFDAVVTCAVFTCIDQLQEREFIISELKRVLKPSGIIYMAEFCSPNSTKFVSGQGVPMWHSSKIELENLLLNFQVEISKVEKVVTMTGDESNASHIFARKAI